MRLNHVVNSSPELDDIVAGCAGSHQRLLAALDAMSDADAASASLLPGWTIGHVLTHLARNADGIRNMLEGAAAGEVRPMYPSLQARTDGIEAGAGRPFGEQRTDLRKAIWALESCWAGLDGEAWGAMSMGPFGEVAVRDLPLRRWRETEIHWLDLGLGHTWRDFPAELVLLDLPNRRAAFTGEIPAKVTLLGDRAELAWLYSRPVGGPDAPPPPPWF